MKVAIIGAGWYGCHVALELKKNGFDVEIYEKNAHIFSETSGRFGIRLHRGPHYPRSKKTRLVCHDNFDAFLSLYPELIEDHSLSIYALGILDAHNYPPKVSKDVFNAVCEEVSSAQKFPPDASPLTNVQSSYNLDEPSIAIGERLRNYFEKKLSDARIPIYLNQEIQSIVPGENCAYIVDAQGSEQTFNYIVNATSYKALVPSNSTLQLPIDVSVCYQPTIGLKYRDRYHTGKPFSLIVMDGWFPCLMPTVTSDNFDGTYIMTHGCYTIMASCQTAELAQDLLDNYDDMFINDGPRQQCESDMERYWPGFTERFEYIGWQASVLAKPKTVSEFRAAITYGQGNTIHIIPGKVANVLNASRETLQILQNHRCTQHNDIRFANGGILDIAQKELAKKPQEGDRSTTSIRASIPRSPSHATLFGKKAKHVTRRTIRKIKKMFREEERKSDTLERYPKKGVHK